MKSVFVIVSLAFALNGFSQVSTQPSPPAKASADIYKYYFLMIKTTGKMGIEIEPEWGVTYEDIDSLIVESREARKKGGFDISGKKYDSYSAMFNALSAAGLEFVEFASLSTVGGSAKVLVGDLRLNYVIWRKKIN